MEICCNFLTILEAAWSLALVSTSTIVSWTSRVRIAILFMIQVNVTYKFTSVCLVLSAVLYCKKYIKHVVPTCCSIMTNRMFKEVLNLF